MVEAVALGLPVNLGGHLPDQPLLNKTGQYGIDAVVQPIRCQLLNGPMLEFHPDHRRRLQDRALFGGRKPRVALRAAPGSIQESRPLRGSAVLPGSLLLGNQALVDEHREQLLDEERITLARRLDDSLPQLIRQAPFAEAILDHLPGLRF